MGQQLLLRDALRREDVRHPGLAAGDGAGFVQGHDLHPARLLQGGGGFEQDAVFGPQATAYHNGHRSGQAQGTGAADHQHGDAPGQGIAYRVAQQQPHRRGHGGDGDHRRDEHAGDLIGDLGDGGLGGGGVADHADDLGQHRVLAHPGSPAAEIAGLVHRGGGHAVAGGLVHGDALAGQGGLIDGAGALQHHAVHRDALPGPDGELVPLLHLLHRHLHLPAVPEHRGGSGSQAHEAFQGVGGFALGPGLQHLAHGDQGQDHGGGLKIEVHHIGHDGGFVAPDLGRRHGEQGIGAVAEGRRGPQGHQGVHIGGPVPQGLIAADEELLVDDHDDPRQQQLGQAHGHMVVVVKRRQGPAPHHVAHGKVHQHQQKAHGPDKPPPDTGRLVVLQLLLVGAGRRLGRALFRRAVPRRLHGGNDGGGLRRALHAHGVGQQAHGAGRDPRDLPHRLFHPGRAGGAAHARDIVLLHWVHSYFISFCRVVTSSSMT